MEKVGGGPGRIPFWQLYCGTVRVWVQAEKTIKTPLINLRLLPFMPLSWRIIKGTLGSTCFTGGRKPTENPQSLCCSPCYHLCTHTFVCLLMMFTPFPPKSKVRGARIFVLFTDVPKPLAQMACQYFWTQEWIKTLICDRRCAKCFHSDSIKSWKYPSRQVLLITPLHTRRNRGLTNLTDCQKLSKQPDGLVPTEVTGKDAPGRQLPPGCPFPPALRWRPGLPEISLKEKPCSLRFLRHCWPCCGFLPPDVPNRGIC